MNLGLKKKSIFFKTNKFYIIKSYINIHQFKDNGLNILLLSSCLCAIFLKKRD